MKKGFKSKGLIKVMAGIVGLIVIVVWTSGLLRSKQKPEQREVLTGGPLPTNATVLTLKTELVPTRVSLPGTVSSARMINLSARLSAYVEDVHVSGGTPVKQGDLLIALDRRELLKQLEAAEAQLTLAETAYQRSKRLLETNATTQQAFEAAESAYKSASAAVDQVKVMLTDTRIQSPIDGIVTDRFVEAGDLANPGQVLVSVYDPSRLRLEVPVPTRLIDYLPVGEAVTIKLDLEETSIAGEVTEVVSQFDPVTRTRRVKIQLEIPENLTVLPGMYGKLLLNIEPHEAILLPQAAITRIGQLESVQVVLDQRVHRRLVRTGPNHSGKIEILSGLAAGETVLIPSRNQ